MLCAPLQTSSSVLLHRLDRLPAEFKIKFKFKFKFTLCPSPLMGSSYMGLWVEPWCKTVLGFLVQIHFCFPNAAHYFSLAIRPRLLDIYLMYLLLVADYPHLGPTFLCDRVRRVTNIFNNNNNSTWLALHDFVVQVISSNRGPPYILSLLKDSLIFLGDWCTLC